MSSLIYIWLFLLSHVFAALRSPAVFPAAPGPVRGRPTPAEMHIPAAACRSSSSGCSGGWSPGSSLRTPDSQAPDRSYRRLTRCWVPGCPTATQSPLQHRYCWSLRAAGNRVTPRSHSTPLWETGWRWGHCFRERDDAEEEEEEQRRLTHFIKAGEAGGHGCVFGGLAKIRCTGWPNFAPLTERFQSVHTHKIAGKVNKFVSDWKGKKVLKCNIRTVFTPFCSPTFYRNNCCASGCFTDYNETPIQSFTFLQHNSHTHTVATKNEPLLKETSCPLTSPPRQLFLSGGWSSAPRCVLSSCWPTGLPSYTQRCGPTSYSHRWASLRGSRIDDPHLNPHVHVLSLTQRTRLNSWHFFALWIKLDLTHVLLLSAVGWPLGWQVAWCSHSPESSSCPRWERPGLWSYAGSLQVRKVNKVHYTNNDADCR